MDFNQKLSPHFTLKELLYTTHRNIDNTPTPEVIVRLGILCVNYLEPLRNKFGPIKVNSGYRSPRLNRQIGGSKTSAHVDGCAADIDPVRDVLLQDMVDWIIEESGMPFDQVILESSRTADWLHLGMAQPYRTNGPRKEAWRFKNGTYTKYDRTVRYGV